MSALEERPLDQLADMIYNVLWQDLLEIWRILHKKMDTDGSNAVKDSLHGAKERFLSGPFADHVEVRWGMDLCLHCNDNNIEKNGIAYAQPTGDGLEFNQCLNCRIGILYNLVTAKATMDSYVIGVGLHGQFNGMSFFWVAIGPDSMGSFQPVYEVVKNGQWIGSVSFDAEMNTRFLPFDNMKESVGRGEEDPWTSEIPEDLRGAIDEFIEAAKEQIQVALLL